MFPGAFSLVVKQKALILAFMLIILALSSCSQSMGITLGSPTPSVNYSPTPLPLEYFSPLANAQYVSMGDTIILRYGPELTEEDIKGLNVSVSGIRSGLHGGKLILAGDSRTVIFKPDLPFSAGEQVMVEVNSLKMSSGVTYQALDYSLGSRPALQAGSASCS